MLSTTADEAWDWVQFPLIKNKNFEKQCHWVKAKWNPRVCSTGLDHGFYQNEVEKKKKKKKKKIPF